MNNLWSYCHYELRNEISVRGLAEKIQVPYDTLWKWWKGEKYPSGTPRGLGDFEEKVLQWAKKRGFDENIHYDIIL
jgi:hypothetical protein